MRRKVGHDEEAPSAEEDPRRGPRPAADGPGFLSGFRGYLLLLLLGVAALLAVMSRSLGEAAEGQPGLVVAASPAESITIGDGLFWRLFYRLDLAKRSTDWLCEVAIRLKGEDFRPYCVKYSPHALLECGFEAEAPIVEITQRLLLWPGARVVLEVGANIGSDLMLWQERFGAAKFYSLEPINSLYTRAKHTVSRYPNVELLNFGLSDADGNATIDISGGVGEASSALRGSRSSGGGVVIQLRDAARVFEELRAAAGQAPDTLSINCEGCEYAVLERLLTSGHLSQVPFLQVSWHKVELANRIARRCAIERRLHETHALAWYDKDFGWQAWALRRPPAAATAAIAAP